MSISIDRLSPSEFSTMEKEWNDFVIRSNSDNLFLRWEWLRIWWTAFGAQRQPYFLVAKSRGRGIVGLFPLQLVKKSFGRHLSYRILQTTGRGIDGYAGGVEYTSRQMPPILPGLENPVSAAFAGFLKYHTGDWEMGYLDSFVGEHPTTSILESELKMRFPATRLNYDVCYMANLPPSYPEFLSGLGGSSRRNLKKQAGALYRNYDVRIDLLTKFSQLPEFLDDYYSLVRSRHSWAPSAAKEAFLRLICEDFLKSGWLRLYILRLNGTPAATLLGFAYNKRFYGYKAAADPAYDGAGNLLQGYVIERAIAEGLKTYDFLLGAHEYKSHWTNCITDVAALAFPSPKAISRARVGMVKLLEKCYGGLRPLRLRMKRVIQ